MAIINSPLETISLALRSHGEVDLAERVLHISDDVHEALGDRAGWYVFDGPSTPSGRSMFIDTALALAAVEILEGSPRPLRWKRRKLKGIYDH